LKVIEADLTHGQQLYQQTCSTCHGEDGSKIIFGVEGVDEYLGSLAYRDPWRFLHRTRFGVAGTNMPVGLSLGWTPADGHDVLAYAQTLPVAGSASSQPTQNPLATPVPLVGGPANNLWTGILTSLGIVIGMGTVACAFIAGFILLALGVVVIFRKRGNRSS